MDAAKCAAYQLRLARAFADEAVRMAASPLSCWQHVPSEERAKYAYRSLEQWLRLKQQLESEPPEAPALDASA